MRRQFGPFIYYGGTPAKNNDCRSCLLVQTSTFFRRALETRGGPLNKDSICAVQFSLLGPDNGGWASVRQTLRLFVCAAQVAHQHGNFSAENNPKSSSVASACGQGNKTELAPRWPVDLPICPSWRGNFYVKRSLQSFVGIDQCCVQDRCHQRVATAVSCRPRR